MRTLLAVALSCASLSFGCDDKPAGPPVPRFAGVAKKAAPVEGSSKAPAFCEKSWDSEGGPRFVLPTTRSIGGEAKEGAVAGKHRGWRWVNVWATWCKPCVEEMGLLKRWADALENEGVPVRFELLSIDEVEDQPKLQAWLKRDLPGQVLWMEDPSKFGAWLQDLGVEASAAIPIHLLIDSAGNLRCARMGAIHDQDYGVVKAYVSGR